MGKKIGYAKVSLNQSETLQIDALKKAGVEEKDIYIEKSLGKNFIGRDSWDNLFVDCAKGDTIVITELNRLGRNKLEIKETFELIQKKGINLEVLNLPLFNAGTSNTLISDLIYPIVLELLDYMANEEKKSILKRQKEAYETLPRDEKGRIISRKKNKPVGRANIFDNMTENQRKSIDCWIKKEISTEECIKITKFSRSTIFRIKKILKSENK